MTNSPAPTGLVYGVLPSLKIAVTHYRATGNDTALWDVCERTGSFPYDLGICQHGDIYSMAYYDGDCTLERIYS